MQPARPCLDEAMSIFGIPEKPPGGGKFGAGKAHRGVLVPPSEHGLVTIMGHNGIPYTNNVGAPGVASAA